MKTRVYQYLYSLLFVLSTIMSWYYGQVQQYISGNETPDIEFHTDFDSLQKEKTNSFLSDDHHQTPKCDVSHSHYNKLRASLSENDNENDDYQDPAGSTDVLKIAKAEFGRLLSDGVTTYHDRKIAVSLSNTELLNTSQDDLYIQYRVIRL